MEIEYSGYIKENRVKFIVKTLTLEERRLPSKRKRDEERERLLTYLDTLRWKRLEREGKISYLGNRTYKINL